MTLLLILGISISAILATNAAIINKPIPAPIKIDKK